MQNVIDVIRECALRRMRSHSMSNDVLNLPIPDDYNRTVHGNWMGLILISGPDIRVTFKAHFNAMDIKQVIGLMMGSDPSEIKQSLAHDFIKEFCNLTAGYIKQVLEENVPQISSGISLPIVTKGFDDLFYQQAAADEITDMWQIEVGGVRIICTPHIQIFDQEKLATLNIPSDSSDEEDDGDIDFL